MFEQPSLPAYRLVRSKRRTLALVIERDGTLTVRAPLRMAEARVRHFIEARSDWIKRKQAEAAKEAPVPHQFVEGELFHFLGKTFPLRLVPDPAPALVMDGDCFRLSRSRQPDGRALFTAWYRAQARTILTARLEHFACSQDVKPARLRISSARTRWGSCSRVGTLSFSWRLVMAPPQVVDYVIVHELAHLREMNHSRAFWALVEGMLPDYKQRRAWLRKNGHSLHL
ncbi:MAG: SprT family zinc-dependent metalloprotease [Anaerolineales bacterium]